MSFDLLRRAAVLATLVALAACDDGKDGGGSGGGGGGGGEPGDPTRSAGAYPFLPTGGAEPLRRPLAICEQACSCDHACMADHDAYVADCAQGFADDQAAAALVGCDDAYAAYHACYSAEWSCEELDACDDETDALSSCLAGLCETASDLCGCPGCAGGCRTSEERCWAACVVEAGSCEGGDVDNQCVSACYEDVGGSSGSGGGWDAGGEATRE